MQIGRKVQTLNSFDLIYKERHLGLVYEVRIFQKENFTRSGAALGFPSIRTVHSYKANNHCYT